MTVSLVHLRSLSFSSLRGSMLKSLRCGSWRGLSRSEKGLYMCVLSMVRSGRRIVNVNLMARVYSILLKLLSSPGLRLRCLGLAERWRLLRFYEARGIFGWASRLREWLLSDEYMLQLGLSLGLGNRFRGV
jgi:hypothetical protein